MDVLKLILSAAFIIFFQCESIYSQKPTTVSFSMIYDFTFFDTKRKVDDYYEPSFNELRKEETHGRPSGGNGIDISYALTEKWMGSVGFFNINYNYEQSSGPFDYNRYGFSVYSIPISFKYYPLKHSEHLSVEAGINVVNMRNQYGIDLLTPIGITRGWEYIETFQLGYQIGASIENHSSRRVFLSVGVHFKSTFTELSQSNLVIHAGEVLTAFGIESKIGYRFHGR